MAAFAQEVSPELAVQALICSPQTGSPDVFQLDETYDGPVTSLARKLRPQVRQRLRADQNSNGLSL